MFLRRFIFWIKSLLFPRYTAKKAQKEKAEIRLPGQQLFSGQKIKAIFPHLKARRNAETGKWLLLTNDKIDAYLLLNALPKIDRAVTKYKPDRILTTVPINRGSTLTLIEYLCPSRTRWGISGKEEVLFARAVIQTGTKMKSIMDFYTDAVIFCREHNCKQTQNLSGNNRHFCC